MIVEHPWFGSGPGTYLPTNALQIVDNQYLHTAIEMGLVGLSCLVLFLVIPVTASLHLARRAAEPSMRLLCGATAASCSVAVVASGTFDSLSFPVFTIVEAVVVGLAGALWVMSKSVPSNAHASQVRPQSLDMER